MKKILLSLVILAMVFACVPVDTANAAEPEYHVYAYEASESNYQYFIREEWDWKTDTQTNVYLYSGKAYKPKVSVYLFNPNTRTSTELSTKDYTVKYGSNMTKVGTHNITVKGKGKYSKLNQTIKVKIVKSWQTDITRIYGQNRYKTSTTLAKHLQNERYGKVNEIFVTSGTRFPDGLSGGVLSKIHHVPILNWDKANNKLVQNYIKANVRKGGTVYVLGGDVAVGPEISKGMKDYKFVRIKGNDRFGTNEAILKHYDTYAKKEYGSSYLDYGTAILCDWDNWESAMIASSTRAPIILVGPKGLTTGQKNWVKGKKKWTFVLFGNEASLNKAYTNLVDLKINKYQITRIKGKNADELSVNFAKEWYWHPKDFYVAKAGIGKSKPKDFADGLCAGTIADGPILLLGSSHPKIDAYIKSLKVVSSVTVIGGPYAVSDAKVKRVAKNSTKKIVVIKDLLK